MSKNILSIKSPEDLFSSNSLKELSKEYKKLLNKYHPDKPKGNHDICSHINELYSIAKERINNGTWRSFGECITIENIIDRPTVKLRFKYWYKRKTEFGYIYVGDFNIVNFIESNKLKQFEIIYHLEEIFNELKYPDERLRKEFKRKMPHFKGIFKTPDGVYLITKKKEKDVIPLRALFDYMLNKLDPKHVAWITSGILNIACFLSIIGINHNAISIDSIFINPFTHEVFLINNWWYCTKNNTQFRNLPKRSFELLPKNKQISEIKLDNNLIKLTIKELLVNVHRTDVPEAFKNWILSPSNNDTFSNYSYWMKKVLPNSFGERKFMKLDIDLDDIKKYHKG